MMEKDSDTARSTDSQHQGKIVTENPRLLSLLRDNSMDNKPVRRIYVDSPVIGATDETKYRFVSTDVEGFDERQDYALQESETARGNTQPQEHIQLNPAPPQAPQRYVDGARYEDRNMRNPSYSTGNEGYTMQTEFVIRSREGDRKSQTPGNSFHKLGPPPVQPIRSPLKPLNKDEEEDIRALKEEKEYQERLQARLQEQDNIPPFPVLEDSLDPHFADSLDAGLADSLDVTSTDRSVPISMKNSTQRHRTPPSRENPSLMANLRAENSRLHREMERREDREDPWARKAEDSAKAELEAKLKQEQMERERLERQLQQKDIEQLRLQQNMQQQLILQQQKELQRMIMNSQQPVTSTAQVVPTSSYSQPSMTPSTMAPPAQVSPQFSPAVPPLPMHQLQSSPPHPAYNYIPPQSAPFANMENIDPREQYYREYQQAAGQPPLDEASESDSDTQDSAMVHHVKPQKSPRQGVDYLEENKKNLQRGPRNTSYRQMLTKRKDMKPLPATVNVKSKKKQSKRQPLPNREVVPQSLPNSASAFGMAPQHEIIPEKPASAEQLWGMRSQSLAHRKEQKLATQEGRRIKRPPQNYPMPQKSMTEPHKAEPQPIRHTVITEDGQQVSVDINLKVVSPTPQAAALQEGLVHHGHLPEHFTHPTEHYPMGLPPPPHGPPPQPRQAFIQPPQPQQAYNMPYPAHVFSSPRQQVQMGPPQGVYTGTGYPYEQPQYAVREDYGQAQFRPAVPPMGSPYRVLPAIGTGETGYYQTDSEKLSPRLEEQGSYMDNYKKNHNRRYDYKKYTLKDYKNLKSDIKLGGLGPEVDTESHREKRDKIMRQQEYAKRVMEKNKVQATKPGRPKQAPPGAVEEEPEDDLMRRRQVALEYARNVPKPRVAPRRPSEESPAPPSSRKASQRTTTTYGLAANQPHEALEAALDLEELRLRHERERQQVALIKQNMNQQTVS